MVKVCLIGTLPPPLGGVTIHINRLLDLLKKSGIDVCFVEARKDNNGNRITKKELIRKYLSFLDIHADIIHYQLNKWTELLIVYAFTHRKVKLVSTIHSFRVDEFSLVELISYRICRHCSIRCIAPSESIKRKLIESGFPSKKIIIQDTYIPPSQYEKEKEVPITIRDYINGVRKKNGFIVLGSASKLYLNKDGKDVYGLDFCIDACKRINDMYLVFCVSQFDERYLNKCKKTIRAYGVEEKILLYTENTDLIPIYSNVDVFVRPSVTDSFGISVAEAIDSGIPAVASDVCERAKGAILYENGNIQDFCEKICYARGGLELLNEKKNYLNIYSDIYSEIYSLH